MNTIRVNENLWIGKGIYSVSEASRLTGVSTQEIRRWLNGYRYTANKEHSQYKKMPPLWEPDIIFDGDFELSFRDLLEVMFVRDFRRQGVSLQTIRKAVLKAAELFDTKHPLICKRFQSDGRNIFATVFSEENEDERLIDIVKSQYAFNSIITPSLYKGIEFSNEEIISKWYPQYPKKLIVIDPSRSFGRPISEKSGIPTETLATAVKIEGSIEDVANIYQVNIKEVKAALEFEQGLNKAA